MQSEHYFWVFVCAMLLLSGIIGIVASRTQRTEVSLFWPSIAGAGVLVYVLHQALFIVAVVVLAVLFVGGLAWSAMFVWRFLIEVDERKGDQYLKWCQAQKLLADAAVTIVPDKHRALVRDHERHTYQLIPAVQQMPPPEPTPPMILTEPAAPPLLPFLCKMDRVLIIGGMGTGKSTLMRHIVRHRMTQGKTIVIDSHAGPNTWECEVVGRGRNYDEITSQIKALHKEMDVRYKQLASGELDEGRFPQVNIIIDEFTILNKYCKVKDEISSILCECRKIGFTLCIGGQSDRVKSLGLAGEGDLIQGFEAICYLEKAEDGERYGLVKTGRSKDKKRYVHPGIFAQERQLRIAQKPAPKMIESALPKKHNSVVRKQGKSAQENAQEKGNRYDMGDSVKTPAQKREEKGKKTAQNQIPICAEKAQMKTRKNSTNKGVSKVRIVRKVVQKKGKTAQEKGHRYDIGNSVQKTGKSTQKKVQKLHKEGKSVSTISKEIFGRCSKKFNDEIRSILSMF